MIEVLLFANARFHPAVLAEGVARLHERGARVRLASMAAVEEYAESGLDEVRFLRAQEDALPPDFWRQISQPGERMWRFAELDAWTSDRAAQAHVLVALEAASVYTVWNLARSNRAAAARFGLHPALRAVDEMLAAGGPPSLRPAHGDPAQVRRAVAARPDGAATDRGRVSALAPVTLLRPGLSDQDRVARAVPVIESLLEAGRTAKAVGLTRRVGKRLSDAKAVADLLGQVAAVDLAAGRTPPGLRDAFAAELRYADELLDAGDVEAAVGSFLQATRLAYHRAVHFDSTRSPLADDPAGYVSPLLTSGIVGRLTRRRGRAEPAEAPPSDRPARVLIVTDGNTNFVGDLRRHLEEARGAEVRMLEPRDLERARRFVFRPEHTLISELKGDRKARAAAEEDLRPHLDWADVAFVDWTTRMAYVFGLVDPGTTRTVLRLHSYEAWTQWPQLIDYSRIDKMVFVSDHLRELTQLQVPALRGPGSPDVRVVPNAMDLRRFLLPKDEAARFTVGVLGYQVVAKDVRWAVEVIRALRQVDERYRLVLIGDSPAEAGTAAFRRYVETFDRDLAELEPLGVIRRTGRTEDVPAALTEVGVILSSSVREGSPLAVLEGAASGAVPVVRNWPFFAASEFGPRALYPHDWVVDTVQQAVERVVDATSDPERWRRESANACAHALATYDLTETQLEFDKILFG